MEKNVAADRQAAMEMVRISGQQGVPVITVDGVERAGGTNGVGDSGRRPAVVIGFDQPRLMQLLRQAKPRLGASIADAVSQQRKHPGIPEAGAYVGQVQQGSPADRAGLRPGDVIVALGGQPVARAGDVHSLLQQVARDRDLSLTYVRDGQQRETLVRL